MFLHFGEMRFHAAPRDQLMVDPTAALAFDGRRPDPSETIIHGWTPREAVRRAIVGARSVGRFRTILHLEDDERILTSAHLGRPWRQLHAMAPRALDSIMAPSLTHPHRLAGLLAAVDGVTAIAHPLLAFAAGPRLLLRPGCDPGPRRLAEQAGVRLRERLGVPAETKLIVYPGNLHPANRDEILSLYVAVELLRRRGWPALLLRTGEDFGAAPDVAYTRLKGRVSRELGRVSRATVLCLMAAADLLIQPGPPGPFNQCRLPSKLPEFFASGRPVILPEANLGLEVEDGVSALVSRRGDGFELAALAERLLRDPGYADAVGEAGRRFAVARLDWNRAVQGLEGFYRQLLEVTTPRRSAA